MSTAAKPAKNRRAIAHDAGLSGLSLMSVLAGVLTAYGTFAIVAAIVGASLSGSGVETDFRTNDWTGSGAVAALASAATLLVAYLFGGYVAGRMARRNATLHGLVVFLLSLVAGAAAGAVVGLVSDNEDLESNLQSIGVPTSSDQIKGVAIAAAAVSLAAILIGSILGAMLGERWHTKLARRAVDPDYGREAEARARAEQEEADRRDRVEQDEAIRREHEERAETERGQAERRSNDQHDPDQRHDDRAEDRRRSDQDTSAPDTSERPQSLADDPDWHDAPDRQRTAPDRPVPDAHESNEPPRYTAEEWRRIEGEQRR